MGGSAEIQREVVCIYAGRRRPAGELSLQSRERELGNAGD
jgi:hypothetical protein